MVLQSEATFLVSRKLLRQTSKLDFITLVSKRSSLLKLPPALYYYRGKPRCKLVCIILVFTFETQSVVGCLVGLIKSF